MTFKKTLLALAIAAASTAALADIRIGVSLALTGPGSGLGIPMQSSSNCSPRRSPEKRSSWRSSMTPPTRARVRRTRAASSPRTRST